MNSTVKHNLMNGFRAGAGPANGAWLINWILTIGVWAWAIYREPLWGTVAMLGWFTLCVVVNSIWEKSLKHGFRRAFGLKSKRRPFETSPADSYR